MTEKAPRSGPRKSAGIFGSLRDALAAASREQTSPPRGVIKVADEPEPITHRITPVLPMQASAAEALRVARTPILDIEPVTEPTTEPAEERTQLLRGRTKVTRGAFHQDPVVGWLVVVGGPGLGASRAIFEGNNTVGRAPSQRIPIDFGDDSISSEEQAYIRYDSTDRSFLFVPNLSKTNVVAVNEKKPTGAVVLTQMDVIVMGRTQLAFVPFCSQDFDWSELSELKD